MNFHEYQAKQLFADYGIAVPAGRVASSADEAVALGALERAERGCLISNSLKAPVHLRAELAVAA